MTRMRKRFYKSDSRSSYDVVEDMRQDSVLRQSSGVLLCSAVAFVVVVFSAIELTV